MHLPALPPAGSSLALQPFDSQPRTRLLFGEGTLERIGDVTRDLGVSRVLLVTDRGIVEAGHASRAISFLEAAGLHVAVYGEVRENPSTEDVAQCVAVAKAERIDALIGLGGGSSLDTAKGCNFIYTNGGRMQDYWGIGKAAKPMLPLIAIPTTAGTGSECQSFALISDETTHQKMACGDPKAAARVAILDPALTVSQPPRVTACTGVDAIAHALETAVTRKRNVLSTLYSREAFRLCMGGIERVLREPGDLEARGMMLLGAAFAGTAIENSMLGAAHSAANPLTAHFGIVHGQAVGRMLPAVIRFNAEQDDACQAYEEYARVIDLHSVEDLVLRLEEVLALAQMNASLSELGVARAMIPTLASDAAKQWTAHFNPRTAEAPDFARLYEEAFA